MLKIQVKKIVNGANEVCNNSSSFSHLNNHFAKSTILLNAWSLMHAALLVALHHGKHFLSQKEQ